MEVDKILNIDNLSKNYGRIKAVDQLTLTVKPGSVYGLLGPNGSGKTTTLGMILDVVPATSGSFQWFDGMSNTESRLKIGSILESPCFYPFLTAEQNLRIVAHIKKTNADRIPVVLDQVGLIDRKRDKFKTYSLGMKQRLSIASALLSDPPVLILDEPTNGLDPEGIAEVRTLIRNIAHQGKTIILASHLLDEVQRVCSEFCILRKGVKLYDGLIADITGETNKVEISSQDLNALGKVIENADWIQNVHHENSSLVIELDQGKTSEDVNRYCFDQGIPLRKLITQKNSLEQEFLKILQEND